MCTLGMIMDAEIQLGSNTHYHLMTFHLSCSHPTSNWIKYQIKALYWLMAILHLNTTFSPWNNNIQHECMQNGWGSTATAYLSMHLNTRMSNAHFCPLTNPLHRQESIMEIMHEIHWKTRGFTARSAYCMWYAMMPHSATWCSYANNMKSPLQTNIC